MNLVMAHCASHRKPAPVECAGMGISVRFYEPRGMVLRGLGNNSGINGGLGMGTRAEQPQVLT